MDANRELQIAKFVLREILRKQGIQLSGNTLRDLKNKAQKMGVPLGELQEFARPFVQELVDECFGTKIAEAVGHAFSK